MKSVRSIDTSLESEGITDTKLFPGNPNLMCITSTAFNSSPLVINTKITQINGVRTVAQPSMLIRVDEIGCKIHKCEISPRNDAIAFLDRNGSVYIMCAPTMMDNNEKEGQSSLKPWQMPTGLMNQLLCGLTQRATSFIFSTERGLSLWKTLHMACPNLARSPNVSKYSTNNASKYIRMFKVLVYRY